MPPDPPLGRLRSGLVALVCFSRRAGWPLAFRRPPPCPFHGSLLRGVSRDAGRVVTGLAGVVTPAQKHSLTGTHPLGALMCMGRPSVIAPKNFPKKSALLSSWWKRDWIASPTIPAWTALYRPQHSRLANTRATDARCHAGGHPGRPLGIPKVPIPVATRLMTEPAQTNKGPMAHQGQCDFLCRR